MNYYFISSDQQRFSPFQESISQMGESYVVEELDQLAEALPDPQSSGVFFIHLIEPKKRVEDFVKAIRRISKTALIIHVIEESKGFDLKKHQSSAAGGDAYVSMKSSLDNVRDALEGLGLDFGSDGALGESEGPPGLATKNLDNEFSDMDGLVRFSNHAMSKEMDSVFRHLLTKQPHKILDPAIPDPPEISGASMADSQDDNSGLSLISDFGELSLADENDVPPSTPVDEGMDLMLSDGSEDQVGLSLTDEPAEEAASESSFGDLSLSEEAGAAEDDFSLSESPELPADDLELSADLDAISEDAPLDFTGTSLGDDELSEDAKEKLREIDAIMENTSSQIIPSPQLDDDDLDTGFELKDSPDEEKSLLDESLVADDLDLDSLDFSGEQKEVEEEKPKKKKKEEKPPKEVIREASTTRALGSELKEISGAYTVEMERAQATISNLRADREELLAKIQQMEEEKVMHNRQALTVRAELDERKIELSIIRKKLNEEISELKDRLKFHDERRLILEEKNRILTQELDKSGHKNKLDLRKIQMRERELEQKLELLKSDAETQIRHRDLKILELKRKIDAMEFDMESISTQEKKSVESRFELEDKLDKAIKTLRSAITVLEDESDRESAVQALKKNIDV